MGTKELSIQARIYPDADDLPEGTVKWWIEPHGIWVVARYYLLQDIESVSDVPPVMMIPQVINLHNALILHGIESEKPLPFCGHMRLFNSFTEEAQRDFPAIWRQQCRYTKALAQTTARRYLG